MTANDSDATSQGRFPHAIDGFYATFSVPDNAAHASKGSPRAGPNSINVPGRRAPRAGEIFRNPDLAKTLTLIAENGCDAFYNGTIAQAIASFASIGEQDASYLPSMPSGADARSNYTSQISAVA